MKINRLFVIYIVAALFAFVSKAFALPPNVQMLVDMETKANAVATRSNTSVPMPHYEIPLSLLVETKEFALDPSVYQSLIFDKNGEAHVRFVVNPEDTKWFLEVEKFMVKHNLKPERKFYFTGYQTASRSYIVEDPSGKVQFSIKTSTDKTGGNWTDKKQPLRDGQDAAIVSDYLSRIEESKPFETAVIMKEPLVIGIKDVDQSIVVRELGALSASKNGQFYYIPGFSVLHETTGKKIAKINGSNDPEAFWKNNYLIPMAKAAAELYSRSGVWFDSPHGQNFLVELDKNYKPTGRIVMRDLSDALITKQIPEALGERRLLKDFSESSNIRSSTTIPFGPLHGNKAPTWISASQYKQWGQAFKDTLVREIVRHTQLPSNKISVSLSQTQFSYYVVSLTISDESWKEYLPKMKAPIKFCSAILLH
jgi:hypothetical protein